MLGIVVEAYLEERFFKPVGLKHRYTFPKLPASLGPTICYVNGVRQRPIAENIGEMNGAVWNLKGNDAQ